MKDKGEGPREVSDTYEGEEGWKEDSKGRVPDSCTVQGGSGQAAGGLSNQNHPSEWFCITCHLAQCIWEQPVGIAMMDPEVGN